VTDTAVCGFKHPAAAMRAMTMKTKKTCRSTMDPARMKISLIIFNNSY
jgi:hypothetical protein